MADSKISDLSALATLADTDELAVASSGNSQKISGANLKRSFVGADGWIDDTNETWTYASGSGGGVATFTVPGDLRTKYSVGTRIKLTQTTVKFFVVTAVAYNGSTTTTVTIFAGSDYTLANVAISANGHSYDANPQGWPGWFTYDCAPTGFSGTPTQRSSRFAVVGRTCHVYVDITGTSNSATFTVQAPISYPRSFEAFAAQGTNSGSSPTSPFILSFRTAPSTTVDVFRTWDAGTSFTSSGTKSVQGSFTYEI